MSDDVIVTWEIEDGYAGRSRPQTLLIPREDWDACKDDAGREALADERVAEALSQIGYSWEWVES